MIHLDLQPESEAQLSAESQARGMAPGRYIEEMLRAHRAREMQERAKTRSVADAIDRILQLREDTNVAGLNIKDLINEGRKY